MAEKAAAHGGAHDPTVVTKTLEQVAAETGLSMVELEALIRQRARVDREAFLADQVTRLEGKVEKQRAQLADAEAALKAARAEQKGS